MIEAPTLLRSYIEGIRRLSGASAVSLFVPPLPGGFFHHMLIHCGAGEPIPELIDFESAEGFDQEAVQKGTQKGTEPGDGAVFASTDPECGLILLPGIQSPWELATLMQSEREERRRRSDSGGTKPIGQAGAWLGLRFSGGRGSVLDQIKGSDLPVRVQSARDPARWWEWLFALGGALASHTTHVSAILKDSVTGLPDRRAFQTVLTEQLDRATSEGMPLTLLLLNPDQFNAVNDRFGREIGDNCVREISDRIRPVLRITDMVARYGGVVFAAVLVDTPLDEATEVSERILAKLSAKPFVDGKIELTFSIGLGSLDLSDDAEIRPLHLVRRADQALNAAKRLGGNTVLNWQDPDAVPAASGFDRLSGIFTGNMAKDYRNMSLLRDTIDIVAAADDFESLASRLVDRMYSAFTPDRIGIFAQSDTGELELLSGLTRRETAGTLQSRVETVALEAAEKQNIFEVLTDGQAAEFPSASAAEAERTCYIAPLMTAQNKLGCLMIEGRTSIMTVDPADLIFLQSVGTQVAVALDRARLAELELTRQDQERRRLRAELSELRQALQHVKMVYRSPQMEELVATARRVAPTDATVLITGPSGTGKELLAGTVHQLSNRKDRPFVIVDCGAISSTLIESELFGHERGAYTGAEKRRTGRLVEARDGTVLLDEIGELPLEVQSKLLRFVQDKELITVGGSRTQSVDVRIIAATNRDLAAEVKAGRFREDLYHRLNVVCLEIPPLRERPDDIHHLSRHFLEIFAFQYQKPVPQLSREAERQLLEHPWQGNVRELQNRILQAVILSENSEITSAELGFDTPSVSLQSDDIASDRSVSLASPLQRQGPSDDYHWLRLRQALARQIARIDRATQPIPLPLGRWLRDDLLLEAEAASNGVARRASDMMGMPESTFRRRLRSASEEAAAGLATRSEGWIEVRGILADLTASGDQTGGDFMSRSQTFLLQEVLERYPTNVRLGSQLLGVSPPTYRRRIRELQSG